jgi:bacterioferritin
MKNESKIVEYLNTALRMEMTAQARYMLHSRLLTDWGFTGLAAKVAEEAAEERGHAERFVDRILFLGGIPEVAMGEVRSSKSIKEMFKTDLADEEEAVRYYTEAYKACTEAGDIGSQVIFHDLVLDEEGHADWLQTELGLMEKLGEQNYLQLQVSSASGTAV